LPNVLPHTVDCSERKRNETTGGVCSTTRPNIERCQGPDWRMHSVCIKYFQNMKLNSLKHCSRHLPGTCLWIFAFQAHQGMSVKVKCCYVCVHIFWWHFAPLVCCAPSYIACYSQDLNSTCSWCWIHFWKFTNRQICNTFFMAKI